MADLHSPGVSVCIPAYKRPVEIRRAVASVFAQTYRDWELVISDDEDPAGATWEYLRELPKQDSRVRVMQNPGPHGQVPNMNRTLQCARGTWVKPLHHDDALRPECLETLLLATRGSPSVVIVSSLFDYYSSGRHVRTLTRGGTAAVEIVPQRYIHLGMYLQDCSVGLPSQVMVHRKSIEHGALFEEVPGVISSVDVLWNCAVSKYGDLALVNKALVEHHQDAGTITASLGTGQLEAEYPIALQRELECIDPSLKPPPLSVVLEMVGCMRALHHLKAGEMGDALRRLLKVRHPYAWFLIARWLLAQSFPGKFHVAPRIPVVDQR
jgi:hypothetical protein